MYLKTFVDEKLAQNAYLVGCQKTGEAIIIDPPRYFKHIIADAEQEGLKITAAAETHIHADYVSGARQLAVKEDAKLYLSDEGDKDWQYEYGDRLNTVLIKEGSKINIGKVELEVMHTPGHTPESLSFVLTDHGGGATEPMGIFTGDFVFVGDVGRPDLLEEAAGAIGTSVIGAKEMFHSVQRFKQLPDSLIIWPGHGAGSACGKSLGSVPISTVGYEKQVNWALRIDEEQAFINELLKDQPEAPTYFAQMKKVNKQGPTILETKEIPIISDSNELKELLKKEDRLVIDTRPAKEAQSSLIQGSINIPFDEQFTEWAGWLIKYDEQLLLLTNESDRRDVEITLQSIGFDALEAFIDEEVLSELELDRYETITMNEFITEMEDEEVAIIDIRKLGEWNEGHFDRAEHLFLGNLRELDLPTNKKIIVHCERGARSAIAASIFKARGCHSVYHMRSSYADTIKHI